jgi:hypothetical protein
MILLKDLISEKIQNVKWIDKAYDYAYKFKFPISDTIGKMINKSTRIEAFHVTSPDLENLKRMESLIGSKKSISCMRQVPRQTTLFLGGVHHNGVVFHVEGNLLLKGKIDIMSEPDEQGRRWIKFNSQISTPKTNDLQGKWKNVLLSDSKWVKMRDSIMEDDMSVEPMDKKTLNNLYRDFIDRHVSLANEFAKKNASKIKTAFNSSEIDTRFSSWDELLLNDIKLLDCVWDEAAVSRFGEGARYVKKVEAQLKSMVSGKVTKVNTGKGGTEKTLKSFIKSGGGKVSKFY